MVWQHGPLRRLRVNAKYSKKQVDRNVGGICRAKFCTPETEEWQGAKLPSRRKQSEDRGEATVKLWKLLPLPDWTLTLNRSSDVAAPEGSISGRGYKPPPRQDKILERGKELTMNVDCLRNLTHRVEWCFNSQFETPKGQQHPWCIDMSLGPCHSTPLHMCIWINVPCHPQTTEPSARHLQSTASCFETASVHLPALAIGRQIYCIYKVFRC